MAAPASHPEPGQRAPVRAGRRRLQARVRVVRFRVGQDQFVVVSEPIVGAADFPVLSQTEREVARLVADGRSNQAIAAERGVVPRRSPINWPLFTESSRSRCVSQLVARLVDPLAKRRGCQRGP